MPALTVALGAANGAAVGLDLPPRPGRQAARISPAYTGGRTQGGDSIARDTCRIGIDAGTGAVRVAAHRSRDGRVLAHASAPFVIATRGERREVDFPAIGRAQDEALAATLARLSPEAEVESIGIAATASTVAVVSSVDGAPLGPGLLWADHRAGAEASAMRRTGHPNLDRMLGHVSPEWGIAKLAHLVRSGELDGVDRQVVEIADWLAHRLTGVWAANAGTREWGWAGGDTGRVPASLLEAAGATGDSAGRVLAEVRSTGDALGRVRADLPGDRRLAGVTVLVGGMDSYLAAVGMGVARAGRLCLSVGSSSAAIGGAACGDATGRMFGPLRTILPGEPMGAWHGGQTTAGLAAAWAAGVLGRSPEGLERMAAACPPGARGATFRETMLDRRTPAPRAPTTGGWSGLRPDHGPGDLYRAVLEGIAFGLAEACGGLRPREIVATGGMLRSRLFREILADVLGQPIQCLRELGSAAALGAAFADEPTRIADLVPVTSVTAPGGADYEDARRRYLAAELPEPVGGGR